jgi:LAS superfamily LD-carboxypeptidase LdcB
MDTEKAFKLEKRIELQHITFLRKKKQKQKLEKVALEKKKLHDKKKKKKTKKNASQLLNHQSPLVTSINNFEVIKGDK